MLHPHLLMIKKIVMQKFLYILSDNLLREKFKRLKITRLLCGCNNFIPYTTKYMVGCKKDPKNEIDY